MCFEIALDDLRRCSADCRFAIGTLRGDADASPVEIQINARALAQLLLDASHGLRVYELMQTRRAGDLHHYVEIRCLKVQGAFWRALSSKRDIHGQPVLRKDEALLVAVDDVLLAGDMDEASDAESLWTANRREAHWDEYLDRLLNAVRAAQQLLEQSDDVLVQRELALIRAGRHVRDRLARVPRHAWVPAHRRDTLALMPESVRQQLLCFIEQRKVREVTCLVPDLQVWRGLIALQLSRADCEGITPEAALRLYAPDMGYPCSAEDVGGQVHVSYEGFVASQLTVLAGRPYRAPGFGHAPASLTELIRWSPHQVQFVVSKEDLGELTFATRRPFGNWWLYEAATQ